MFRARVRGPFLLLTMKRFSFCFSNISTRHASLLLAATILFASPLTTRAQNSGQNAPSAPATPTPPPAVAAGESDLFNQATQLRAKGDYDGAISKLNDLLQADPHSLGAHVLRGDLYTKKKQWSQAQQDFQAAADLDPSQSIPKFDLAELLLMQKQYDPARSAFQALVKDPDLGDLAQYKVFLCDLFGGHVDAATAEFQALDRAENGASYYYAHAAWNLYHQQPEDARAWLTSAQRIYPGAKNYNYASTLFEFGYLPLPPVK